MVRSVIVSGTQTADGSENILIDDTTHEGEIWDGSISMVNLDGKDTLIVRLYQKTLSGGTLDLLYADTFNGIQSDSSLYIRPITIPKEWKLTLQQTYSSGGSYKTFPWTLYH